MPLADIVIIGQGLAGSTLAWTLHWRGLRVFLIDSGKAQTASKIAAGLITPLTGRRMASPPQYGRCFDLAVDFYRRVEAETGIHMLDQKPSVRLFTSEEQAQNRDKSLLIGEGFVPVCDSREIQIGVEMQNAARLHAARYLTVTRRFFAELGQYREEELDLDKDLSVDDRSGMTQVKGQVCRVAVLCQGYLRQQSRWFSGLPDAPVKGEILRLKIPGYGEQKVVHKKVWIFPETSELSETTFLAGATYDRENLDNIPTDSGAQEILAAVRSITPEEVEIEGHFAAVRAGMKRRKPVAGPSAHGKSVFILNGLGSRGALLAPVAARAVLELLDDRKVEEWMKEVIDVLPGSEVVRPSQRKSLTQLAHNVIGRIVEQGDTVIDATAGNGNDTLKLAALAGGTGQTIAIDVQPEAIRQTALRLATAGLNADLRVANHAVEFKQLQMAGIRAKAVMFNLGYLPGSDKTITTSTNSTQAALQTASEILVPGGAITVIAYRGHAGGEEEAAGVAGWIAAQPADLFETSRIEGDPDNQTSPVLFIVRRNE